MSIRRLASSATLIEDADIFAPTLTQISATKVNNDTLKELGLSDKDIENWQHYISKKPVQWDAVRPPDDSFFVDYDGLPEPSEADIPNLLNKVVVVKLNGGLGNKMGCTGPKSTIEVTKGLTFLDLHVVHIENLNKKYNCDVPLVLMNSFNTDAETKKIIQKYDSSKVNITTFEQSKLPRLYKDTLNPVPKASTSFKPDEWYPPGSGDVFPSLLNRGLLDKYISEGKEYLFIANVESLGALIVNHLVSNKINFAIEVTNRISTDIAGGILVKYKGKVHLMEMSQAPYNRSTVVKRVLYKYTKISQFKPQVFKFWNTNNMWVNLKEVKSLLEKNALDLDFVVTPGSEVRNEILIETPAGMGIQSFSNAAAIHVPRIRYRPVKDCSQLMVAQSNLFQYSDGVMIMDPRREPATVPLIKLGEEFSLLPEYTKRMKSIPDIMELEHLTVSGDVWFGTGVTLKGTVIIVANHGERIDIPDGVVLENKIISGNMRILEH